MLPQSLRRTAPRRIARVFRRHKSTNPVGGDPTGATAESASKARVERFNARLPRFLRKYTTTLFNAPISHISSFLILHEITAVVPLLGLAGYFHYSQWLPPYFSEGKWISEGIQRFGRWFRRRGWLGQDVVIGEHGEIAGIKEGGKIGKREVWWGRGEGGVRIVVEFATAYAITKALLPLRLVLSVWATPWFARVAVIPSMNAFKGIFKRRQK